MALKERHFQVTLLKRLWVAPPVPPLADPTIVPELRRSIHLQLVSDIHSKKSIINEGRVLMKQTAAYLSVCISEVGVIACAFNMIR